MFLDDVVVERMARALFARTREGRNGFMWPLNGAFSRERDMEDAHRALTRILGDEYEIRRRDDS